jgi:hypothetical protein
MKVKRPWTDSRRLCTCSAAYIVALLHDGFGVGMEDRSIAFAGGVRSPEGIELGLDWTLGDPPYSLLVLIQYYLIIHY